MKIYYQCNMIEKRRRHRFLSLLLDVIMVILTDGAWLIWMLIRHFLRKRQNGGIVC